MLIGSFEFASKCTYCEQSRRDHQQKSPLKHVMSTVPLIRIKFRCHPLNRRSMTIAVQMSIFEVYLTMAKSCQKCDAKESVCRNGKVKEGSWADRCASSADMLFEKNCLSNTNCNTHYQHQINHVTIAQGYGCHGWAMNDGQFGHKICAKSLRPISPPGR
jgi:hypothetical protein